MLKLTYSDADFLIEHLDVTVEAMVTQRSLVAVRAGQPLVVQPGYGAFALPADLPGVAALKARGRGAIDVGPCDIDWLEVTLRGTWLADNSAAAEGILVAELGPELEQHLVTLWERSRCLQAACVETLRGR
ncbi:alr0857 family protein [Nodosilinea nodulosa]|uniref:alr0857 family protein n=1 Tax=Nodosilinea nodulosa TaxID=416001 RepID=UPI00037925BC|nr:alr0857 family protein [Nodosilinea nodulosa]